MAKTSATQRTMKYLKDRGCMCGIVEKFNPHVGEFGIRQDLFGFIDIISVDPDSGIVAIQSCGQSFADHIKKMTEEEKIVPKVIIWLQHAPLQLIGWRKLVKKKGSLLKVWKPRIANFWLEDNVIKWLEV